jgi:hypothetical protein
MEILLGMANHLDDVVMNALALTNIELQYMPNRRLCRRDVIRSQSRSLAWAANNGVEGTVQRAVDARPYFINPTSDCNWSTTLRFLSLALINPKNPLHINIFERETRRR